jgi:CheY-like chemotaxis protein
MEISKLASLGNLSSGIAHEINNPLVAVKGFAQLIEMSTDSSATIRNHAKEIIRAAVRIQKITDHLRSFAKDVRKEEWAAIDINEPIRRSLMLLEQQLNYRGIEVKLELGEKLSPIWGDRHQLERAFHHLLTNSRDAFAEVKDERVKEIRIKTEVWKKGVQVIYRDNATGIPDPVRAQMFTPFFTTKERSAGLGLPILHKIMEEHQVSIDVETQLGSGTRFILFFPEATTRSETAPPAKRMVKLDPGSRKFNVLIVDDESAAGEVLALYTKDEFKADVFTDPRKATAAMEHNKYDLVLTDLNMPGMSGLDVLAKAQQCQSGTPVVVISAYGGEDEEVQEAIERGAAGFLQKPFEGPAEVRAFLRETIESAKRKAA